MTGSVFDHVRHRGLQYLAKQQLSNGGYASDSSSNQHAWKPDFTYQTTFVPALILASLSQLNEPTSLAIRQRLAGFLQTQASAGGSFNYWAQRSLEHKTLPYPDDLDDTFCALVGLFLHQPNLITPARLAQTVKLLLAAETEVGGPYRTWLAPPPGDVWQDVDIAVNANIAYFAQCMDIPLPNVQAYLQQASTKDLSSSYYPGVYPLWYYLARAASNDIGEHLADQIEEHLALRPQLEPLATALILCALCHLRPQSEYVPPLAASLLEGQLPNGAWPAGAFCIDPVRRGKTHYHGSPSLTTAFALEGLARFQTTTVGVPTTKDAITPTIVPRLQQQLGARLERLSPPIRDELQKLTRHLQATDHFDEITLLPYYFTQSCQLPGNHYNDEQFLVQLGLANLFGWAAYTIYDDFLDDEGHARQLPAANVAMRESLQQFATAMPNADFQQRVQQTFESIDAANAWEVTHCRFPVKDGSLQVLILPDYGDHMKLAERSLGHALTPQAILVASGVDVTDHQVQTLETILRHYLIARQLNDDAHDWQDDVRKGHITYVVATILSELNIPTGSHQLDALVANMEQQFWRHTLPEICHTIQEHSQTGQKLIGELGFLRPGNFVQQLFVGIERSVQTTLAKQKDSLEFLQNYRGEKTKS